jgi:hypothetical protein
MADNNINNSLKKLEELYLNKEFAGLRDELMKIKKDISPGLFHYNLGTAFAKDGMFAAARYNFEKAKKEGLNNLALSKNLELTVEQIDGRPELSFSEDLFDFSVGASSSLFLTMTLVLVLFSVLLKKFKVISRVVFVVLLIVSSSPYLIKTKYLNEKFHVGVNLKDLKIYEGPSAIYDILKVVPPGQKVIVGKKFEDWIMIESPMEHAGWVKRNDLGLL